METRALVVKRGSGRVNILQEATRALFLVFVMITLFDPADKVLSIKVPIFCSLFFLALVSSVVKRGEVKLPVSLLIITGLLITYPLGSIFYYFLNDGGQPYAGFLLAKAYLFFSIAIVIYLLDIDAFRYLVVGTTWLAVFVLFMALLVALFPLLYFPLYTWGLDYGVFSIDPGRSYGGDLSFFQMYFVASPMIVIALSFYAAEVFSSVENRSGNIVKLVICVLALVIAGTRANLFAAFMLPILIWMICSKNKILPVTAILALFVLTTLYFSNDFQSFFDPEEASNSQKLGLLPEYRKIFSSNFSSLMLGQGLGVFHDWPGRAHNFVTELTYLEIIRSYGIILGSLLILILVSPLFFYRSLRREARPFVVGYAFYLLMSATNPLLFSSMGIFFFAALVSTFYTIQYKARHQSLVKKKGFEK